MDINLSNNGFLGTLLGQEIGSWGVYYEVRKFSFLGGRVFFEKRIRYPFSRTPHGGDQMGVRDYPSNRMKTGRPVLGWGRVFLDDSPPR